MFRRIFAENDESHFMPSNSSTVKLSVSWRQLHVIFFNLCGGTSGTAVTYWPIVPSRMIGDGDCGEKLVGETEVL
jgi:hypothetical protein